MSRVLPTAGTRVDLIRQLWFIGDCADMPTGLFSGMQFTTTNESPIYIKSITIEDGKISISFTQKSHDSSNNLCAHIDKAASWSTVEAETHEDVLSATIELRDIPILEYSREFDNLRVNPKYVNVVWNKPIQLNNLNILQDALYSSYDLYNDVNITIDKKFTSVYDSTDGVLTIDMEESSKGLFIAELPRLTIEPVIFNRVNGVKSDTGRIQIDIYIDGEKLPAKMKGANWVELDSSHITMCPEFVDTLDNYIAPNTHEGYLPLDDMYTKENIRDTAAALLHTYGAFLDGPITSTTDLKLTGTGVDLTDIDPLVDCL